MAACRPVEIPVRLREMRGCRIVAMGQKSLEIRAIIIVLARLHDGNDTQCDVTLNRYFRRDLRGRYDMTEENYEKICLFITRVRSTLFMLFPDFRRSKTFATSASKRG